MKKIISLLAVAALAGCAASVKPIAMPNGERGYSISCDRGADDWDACYNNAAQVCGGKYQVVDRISGFAATTLGPFPTRSLIVSCKG